MEKKLSFSFFGHAGRGGARRGAEICATSSVLATMRAWSAFLIFLTISLRVQASPAVSEPGKTVCFFLCRSFLAAPLLFSRVHFY